MTAEGAMAMTAAMLTACCTVPQIVRGFSTTGGMSLSAWLQGFGLGAIWTSYGAVTGTWMLVASEGPFAVGSFAVAIRLAPRLGTVLYAAAGLLLVCFAFVAFDPSVCLVLGSAESLVARLLQIVTAWRAGNSSGVSILTWVSLAAANFSWMGVGVLRRDETFALSSGTLGVASLGVVATCLVLNRRALDTVRRL